MHQVPLACHACGTVISVGGGRCPSCGAMQPDAPPPLGATGLSGSIPARRPPRQKSRADRAAPLVAGIGVGTLAVAVILWAIFREGEHRSAAVPVAPPSSAPEADAGPFGDLSRADPGAILARARTRAAAWQRDAELVEIVAGPVQGGRIDVLAGGRVVYTFARPSGGRLGPGARVGSERLILTVGKDGLAASERAGTAARAVAEPDCPLDEAWQKVVASGVPSSTGLDLRYAMSDKHERAVWVASAPHDAKLTRTLDGASCVILVR